MEARAICRILPSSSDSAMRVQAFARSKLSRNKARAAAALTSRVGSVEVEVAASDDLMPGVVSLPHGYGHAADGVLMSRSREVPGVSINDLTDPLLLDVSGNAALNGVPVTVQPA